MSWSVAYVEPNFQIFYFVKFYMENRWTPGNIEPPYGEQYIKASG